MTSVFISDLHLSHDRPELYQAFEHFLQSLGEDVRELYILGDLFEVWIGDDDQSDLALSVKKLLKSVSEQGIKLAIQRGNRDFLLAARFAADTGGEILPDYYVFQNEHHKALLMHGDLLCTDDVDYQRFRKKVHNPVYNFILRNLPISWRQKIASRLRAKSIQMKQNKPDNIMDVNADRVYQCMQQYHVETLIHGHTHRPNDHQLNDSLRRIVLGDWGEHLWWIEANEHGFQLSSAPLQSKAPTKLMS